MSSGSNGFGSLWMDGADGRVALAAREPRWHLVALAAACAFLCSLPLSAFLVSVTYLVLAGVSLIRAKAVWPTTRPFRALWIPWLIAAWIVWTGASIAWSPDPIQGWEELRSFRMALIPLLLWPVLIHPKLLLGGMLAGVAAQQLMQAFQGLEWFGLDASDTMGRLGGLMHPITTGLWSGVGATFWLAVILCGRSRWRWLAIVPLGASMLSLLATGSRGPWLAAAVVLPVMVIGLTIARREARLPGAIMIAAGLMGAGILWPIVGDSVRARLDAAATELERAVEEEVYTTSVGLRIGQTRWCLELIGDAPLIGHGAGAFETAQQEVESHQRAVERRPDKTTYLTRGQPHSTPLHVLVTTGALGGAIAALVIGLSLWRAARMTLGRRRWRDAEPLMAAVPFAIVLWVIGSFFDSYHLSGDRAGLLFVLAAMAIARPGASADREVE